MEACFFGAACSRPNCIYRHDIPAPGSAAAKKSNEPCMAHLAGQCSFTSGTCRNRHVGQQEADTLRAKFAAIRCRHGTKCQTAGCLYIHPGDESDASTHFGGEPSHTAFPPLAPGTVVATGTVAANGTATTNGSVAPSTGPSAFSGSAWRPAPVTTAWGPQGQGQGGAPVQKMNTNGATPAAPAAVAVVPAPAPAAWGQRSAATVTPTASSTTTPRSSAIAATTKAFTPTATYASTAANPQQASSTPPKTTAAAAAAKNGEAAAAAAATALSLNVKAKAFVPGGY
jgi:hypothetical protein